MKRLFVKLILLSLLTSAYIFGQSELRISKSTTGFSTCGDCSCDIGQKCAKNADGSCSCG